METSAFLDILKESVVLSLIVIALMFAIEAFNFTSKGKLLEFLHRSRAGQIISSAILGVIPGCVGGYFSVSMYSKRMFTFGALMAMAVATTGDEAFVMLAMYPKAALGIFAGLLVLGIGAGFIIDAKTPRYIAKDAAECDCPDPDHTLSDEHKSLKHRFIHTLKHGLKIFIWTFCIMAVVELLQEHVDLESWVNDNTALMILLAILIGCIPSSGPHLVFVTMFASGVLPFSVLLANCISQEGHAGLPLIAASRKDFFRMKAIKCVLALVVGFAAMLL